MTLKKAYCYIFYKLYRSFEAAPSKWLSDWKAVFALLVLEIWLLLSIMVYYKVFTKRDLFKDSSLVTVSVATVIFLVTIKYFAFEHQEKWKGCVSEFDKWPKRKNRIGAVIVWSIILLIIGNLVFSFYLMSQIDWQQYR